LSCIFVQADTYKVIRVYDGDTLTALINGQKQSVRLLGIDTPEKSRKKREPGQPYSQQATKFLAGLVLNKAVTIESYGKDRYGRVLGVVYAGQINVNLEIVKNGYAEVYRGTPAKGFDSDPYWEAEAQAKSKMLNIWSQGDKYISPREWRRQNHSNPISGSFNSMNGFNQNSCLKIVSDLLIQCDSSDSVFPPTILYNEGLLLRIILDWFSKHDTAGHELSFSD